MSLSCLDTPQHRRLLERDAEIGGVGLGGGGLETGGKLMGMGECKGETCDG